MLDKKIKLFSVSEITQKIGRITGRDGIYLDEISFKNDKTLFLKGEINGQLCSVFHEARWIEYEMKFKDVKYQRVFDPEKNSDPEEFDSNIVLKSNSQLINNNMDEMCHFFISTYDYNIDVVATSIELTIVNTR